MHAGFDISRVFLEFPPRSLLPGTTKKREIHGALRADWSNPVYSSKIAVKALNLGSHSVHDSSKYEVKLFAKGGMLRFICNSFEKHKLQNSAYHLITDFLGAITAIHWELDWKLHWDAAHKFAQYRLVTMENFVTRNRELCLPGVLRAKKAKQLFFVSWSSWAHAHARFFSKINQNDIWRSSRWLVPWKVSRFSVPEQGSDLIELRLTWREMQNLIFGWFMRIFGEFLRIFGEFLRMFIVRRLRTSIAKISLSICSIL